MGRLTGEPPDGRAAAPAPAPAPAPASAPASAPAEQRAAAPASAPASAPAEQRAAAPAEAPSLDAGVLDDRLRPEADPLADERAARVLLARLGEPGDVRLGAEVARHGPVGVVERLIARTGTGATYAGLATRLGAAGPAAEVVAADLDRLAALGARLLLPGTPEWPTQLDDLGGAAPLLLWQAGGADLRLAALRSVAVVGARAATAYGEHVAAELAAGLAQLGWTVVSGGAFGIDAAAHRGALAVGGVSVAVLAGGVDVPYPRAHESLLARLAVDGAVLSEVAPGVSVRRERFLVRNRLIAALTRGTLVVEAAVRSGSLATARCASDLGRVVMGVPGPVTSAMSAGVHSQLREGAVLVGTVEEVVEAVGGIGELAPERRGRETVRDQLGPAARRVLDVIPGRGGADTGRIAAEAGVSGSQALAMLGLLELEGFVARHRDGWRVVHP